MTRSDVALAPDARVAVIGYGIHGREVGRALSRHGHAVVVVDDRPSDAQQADAEAQGFRFVPAPEPAALDAVLADVEAFVPTPGLPDSHPVFAAARAQQRAALSEFDLAAAWDRRPIVAITGTNGKTTVTTMVTEMLCRSGVVAVDAGNTDVPLVEAIEDPEVETFVVEASSFRLGHSSSFAPGVATWLNFDPDHLDVHADLASYEAAKASIWAHQGPDDIAIANAEDPVVMRNLHGAARPITFGLHHGDHRVVDGQLEVDGSPLVAVADLRRRLPHDLANGLAAATTALAGGADRDAVAEVLRTFAGLAHRVSEVADHDGIRWYDDSKATTPHAVLAGVGGFDSAVLIAGGRNKGVDLSPLRALTPRLRGVVAIGEAAEEIVDVFAGAGPEWTLGDAIRTAEDMEHAVRAAEKLARPGDAVVLSPGCTSYDWYRNYGERGDDFERIVRRRVLEIT